MSNKTQYMFLIQQTVLSPGFAFLVLVAIVGIIGKGIGGASTGYIDNNYFLTVQDEEKNDSIT